MNDDHVRLPAELCVGPRMSDGSSWTILRAPTGQPGTGGFDWHVLDGSLPLKHMRNGTTYVTASLFAPTDEAGEPFAYPPVHFHHAHLRHPDVRSSSLMLQNHADSHCHSSGGGARCFIEAFPPPFAIAISLPEMLAWDGGGFYGTPNGHLEWDTECVSAPASLACTRASFLDADSALPLC
jgi:hypothetical protein